MDALRTASIRILHGYRLANTLSMQHFKPRNPSWTVFNGELRRSFRMYEALRGNLLHSTSSSGVFRLEDIILPVPGGLTSLIEDTQTLIRFAGNGKWPWGRKGSTVTSLKMLLEWLLKRYWKVMLGPPRKPRAPKPEEPEELWLPIPHDPDWEPRPQDDPAHYEGFLGRIERCPDVTTSDFVTHLTA